jgi:hypothetical protein
MSGSGRNCRCTECVKLPLHMRWRSISSIRRHALRDLNKVLDKGGNTHREHDGDALVDAERAGNFAPDHVDMDENVPELMDLSSDEESSDDDEDDVEGNEDDEVKEKCSDLFEHEIFAQWHEELEQTEHDDAQLLVGELLLTYFEWMCVHKPTNESAKAVHKLISLFVPPGSNNMPSWAAIHQMLEIVYANVCQEVDLCPNDCIAFVDAKHPVLIEAGYTDGHRSCCPQCGAARYKPDDGSGLKVPVKRGYYFPLDTFVSSIFRDKHTEEFRSHTTGMSHHTHTRSPTPTPTRTHTHTPTPTRWHTHTHTHTYTQYTHTRTHIHTQYTHIRTYTQMFTFM